MQYMVDMSFPINYDENFMKLVPVQKDHINYLVSKGIVLSYSLSIDRTRLWAIIKGKSEDEIKNILSAFPLYSYFRFTIYPLAFHASGFIPNVSMN
jgi:muconolactone delta-isomerase